MSRLSARPLFDSALVSVTDVCCRAPASSVCGAEERSPAHELVFTRSGVFVKHAGAGGRREVAAEPTHVLCLNRDEPYRVSHPVDGGDDCTVLAFPEDVVAAAASRYEPRAPDRAGAPFGISHAPLDADALLRCHRLRAALRSPTVSPLEAEEDALALLAAVVAAGYRARGVHPARSRPATLRARRDLVESVKVLLAGEPGARHSLAEVARRVASSPYHLARVFRELTGRPIHRHLVRLRLALALERLDGGAGDLSALAHELGFSSHAHFTTTFRRVFGETPGAMRRSMRRVSH